MNSMNFTIEEMDRLMLMKKVQTKELTQLEASKELGISERQVRRILVKIRRSGYMGIKKLPAGGRPSLNPNLVEKLKSALVQECYKGFGPTFMSEKLEERHGLKINRESLRKLMIELDIWKGRTRRKVRVFQRREPRRRMGELIQIDGFHHKWFEDRAPKCCLIVFVDDATSKIVSARFEQSESTLGYFRCIYDHITKYGRPESYYSDKHVIFKSPKKVDNKVEDTQVGRALSNLGIELICAHSSQAKGRVERANATLQDRLIKEMRLRGISTMDDANKYLPTFIQEYNRKFGKSPADPVDAHKTLNTDLRNLNYILSVHSSRTLSKNLEFSMDKRIYQIQSPGGGYRYRKAKVQIYEHMDASMSIMALSKNS